VARVVGVPTAACVIDYEYKFFVGATTKNCHPDKVPEFFQVPNLFPLRETS
jgi:hypothetical protein